jgi:hypothetical protein
MKNIILLSLILLLLISASCNTTEPPSNTTITLKLEDVSCTEAWITLTTANIQLPAAITLKQYKPTGDTVTKNIILSNEDSLLFIDSLLPNQTYKFITTIEQSKNKSNELSVTTLDTTSHNFTFQSWTFGTIGNSVLYDVAIINENNIWAVGEIYVADTSINGYTKYNAVHWNGNNWDLKRIPIDLNGYPFYPVIRSVFAFKENDIWFEAGIHWDGISFKQIPFNLQWSGNVNKLWGSSSSDLYAVGNNGNIAHYQNGNWQKIESGTEINLRDVWGTVDGNEIFISGYSNDLSRSILLYSRNNTVETIWENKTISGTPPYGNLIYSIAGYINNLFISSNQGVFKHRLAINYPVQTLFIIPRRVYNLASSNINDVFTAGDRSSVWHYNGISKKELYINLSVPSPFYSVKVKGNVIVAAGSTVENAVYHQATLIIGNRI